MPAKYVVGALLAVVGSSARKAPWEQRDDWKYQGNPLREQWKKDETVHHSEMPPATGSPPEWLPRRQLSARAFPPRPSPVYSYPRAISHQRAAYEQDATVHHWEMPPAARASRRQASHVLPAYEQDATVHHWEMPPAAGYPTEWLPSGASPGFPPHVFPPEPLPVYSYPESISYQQASHVLPGYEQDATVHHWEMPPAAGYPTERLPSGASPGFPLHVFPPEPSPVYSYPQSMSYHQASHVLPGYEQAYEQVAAPRSPAAPPFSYATAPIHSYPQAINYGQALPEVYAAPSAPMYTMPSVY